MSFGTNLQYMRKIYNLMTQEELAEKMGVSRQTISKWEMDIAFPEMEKAIALSNLFNCSLDELLKNDLNSGSKAYHNIRFETVKGFRYVGYAVVSEMPEDDAIGHMKKWAVTNGINNAQIIGWDFPFASQEQINVFHMHGYCAACIIPNDFNKEGVEIVTQENAKYAVITIEDPFSNPFSLIPNAYKTLYRYIEINGYKVGIKKDILDCFEKEYSKNGVTYMDVYISIV